ncbi:MAG: hypothetical protein J6R26_00020 [Paludibacteraceae bacterium]|nr:hypothetical protein [Paludibacteraceae bacterium]
MKKSYLFLLIVFILGLSSCKSTRSTATYQDPINTLRTVTVADLDVSDVRISYTYKPTYAVRLGGSQNVIKTAVQEALKAHGSGDILIGLEYTTISRWTIFSFLSPIREITVTGRPAKYVNFHSLPENIWAPTKLYPDNLPEKEINNFIFKQ